MNKAQAVTRSFQKHAGQRGITMPATIAKLSASMSHVGPKLRVLKFIASLLTGAPACVFSHD